MLKQFKTILTMGACIGAMVPVAAYAREFHVPSGDLEAALTAYTAQAGVSLAVPSEAVKGVHTKGATGDFSPEVALARILRGTGFSAQTDSAGVIQVMPRLAAPVVRELPAQVAAASATAAGIESVVVTSSKIKGDIQTVPIAITALSQEQLTARQIAGGPDLVKEVPNLTFSKTNFSGYNLEIRGIGTQAISVTTDPAVAVAFNDIPFIRNHFFEQEFYDVGQVEVLRGPQGTLYGRNATAGVVNVSSALPTDSFEAGASVDIGNYKNRRFEGMMNIPIVDDRLDLRVAGEWTKRSGYTNDTTLGVQVDGRDLWSSRVTLGWKPVSDVQSYLVWEHFSETDDRIRSGKQLCKTDPGPTTIDGVPIPGSGATTFNINAANFSQGCLDVSLYSPQAFEVPNGFSLPFISGAEFLGICCYTNPYASTVQSTNLRDIQSAILPKYRARNDTLEFNATWQIDPSFTFISQTGYNNDFLWSSEDYNRFDTVAGIFGTDASGATNKFCDPQLGCSDRLVLQDLSDEKAWQLSQEFRLASNLSGPFNFSVGANYLHYETVEDYYVFANTFTLISDVNQCAYQGPGVATYGSLQCLISGAQYTPPVYNYSVPTEEQIYIDPNPLSSVNAEGHNYFLSRNPYVLSSYALFGESYFDLTSDVKLTAGLRWTDDQKHFIDLPSELLTYGYGYPSTGAVDQKWEKFTGRLVANWSPKLDFTDQTLIYASVSHGYKAGGANPPGPVLLNADVFNGNVIFPDHPLTFKPEFIEAFELGTKNSLLDSSLTFNADVFYYNYTGYQISQIVDRSAINLNFNANVEGAEVETTWEPAPGLRFSFAGGYETSALNKGSKAIDLMDRTAGNPGWILMKPSVGQSSNCIFPTYVAAAIVQTYTYNGEGNQGPSACGLAYVSYADPVTLASYVPNPTVTYSGGYGGTGTIPPGYPGFDPTTAPNNGEGFYKDLSGNQLPNAPHFTASLTGEYTMPLSADWAATVHADFYWQAQQWARVFEDAVDKIRGYSTTNVSLVLSSDTGWQIMPYVKNVFNVTAITGTFLNSDDSGLTTNIFLTDPRLYGIRVTKQFDGGGWPSGGLQFIPDLFADSDDRKPSVWLQLGGNFDRLGDTSQEFQPPFASLMASGLPTPADTETPPSLGLDYEANLSYEPQDSDWVLSAGIRYGRATNNSHVHKSLAQYKSHWQLFGTAILPCSDWPASGFAHRECTQGLNKNFVDETSRDSESHMVLDFTLGKDVGIGTFGGGTSVIAGGMRIAEFTTRINSEFNSDPDYKFDGPLFSKYHDIFADSSTEKRSFRGIGPELTWNASQPVLSFDQSTQLTIDWGVNGAVLFGRQRASGHHSTAEQRCGLGSLGYCYGSYSNSQSFRRSRKVTVPNLGGYAGISMQYQNAKVSFGYRADEFFNAIDGGQAHARSYNRGFYGPYANITLGLGG